MKKLLDFSAMDRLLSLDSSGVLRWKQRRNGRVAAGSVAGSLAKCGHIVVTVNRAAYFAHRVAWLLHYREWPDGLIDHINGDMVDNRVENLRIASHSQNSTNRGGTTGVTVHKCGKYQAQIKHHGRSYYLGLHSDYEAARAAYMAASARLHGEFGARA